MGSRRGAVAAFVVVVAIQLLFAWSALASPRVGDSITQTTYTLVPPDTTTTTTLPPPTTAPTLPTTRPTQPATTTTATTRPPPTTARATTTLPANTTTSSTSTSTSTSTTVADTTSTTSTTLAPLPAPPPPAPTLVALTSAGKPSGPPGVGLQVTGTDYPTPCRTAYFYFESTRIGSGTVHQGRASVGGVSVPGEAHAGSRKVSTRCAVSGPTVQTARFSVTAGGVHRTAFVTSLNEPRQLSLTLTSIGYSALLTALLLLLLGFPSQVFNATLQENYEEVRGWFGRHPPLSDVVGDMNQRLLFPLFVLAGGGLYAWVTPDFGFNMSTLALALGLAVAVAVTTVGFATPTFAYFRSRYRDRGRLLVLPGTVLVGAVLVLLSRLLHFQPGYLYGLLAVFVFHHEIDERTGGRLAAVAAVTVMGLAVLAWVARVPVSGATMRPGVGFWTVVLESALCGSFIIGLESTLVGLLPMRFLDGSRIKKWSRTVWGALFTFALFVLIEVLIAPGSGYVGHTSGKGKITVAALYLAFAGLSFGFWAYFRFRSPRPEEGLAVEGDYGVR